MRLSLPTLAALAVSLCVPSGLSASPPGAPAASPTSAEHVEHARLHFEANRGQAAPWVRYQARASGYRAAIGDAEAVLVAGKNRMRVVVDGGNPPPGFASTDPTLEDAYMALVNRAGPAHQDAPPQGASTGVAEDGP